MTFPCNPFLICLEIYIYIYKYIYIYISSFFFLFSFLTIHSVSHALTITGNLVSKHNHIQSKQEKEKGNVKHGQSRYNNGLTT
jgi:hypothetical protein